VTQNESQVSVGGLLALDQVLRKHWLGLTTFGLQQAGRRWSAQADLRSWDITYFLDPTMDSLGFFYYGFGMSAHGFTHD
jgi:hypothetical protein